MYSKTFLIITFVVFLNFKSGYSIKCWDCSSEYDPNCNDPFQNNTFPLVDCDQVRPPPNLRNDTKAVACKKVKQMDHGNTIIVRSCSYMKPKDHNLTTCVEESYLPPNVTVLSCHVCDSETGCNPATTILPQFFLQMILPISFVYLLK